MTGSEVTGRTGSFRPVLGASVLLFLTVLGIAGVKSSHDLEAARQRKLLLETRIQAADSEIGRLKNRIERLRSDPGLLERHAREDLGMVRPGDVVIELPIETAVPAPLPPAGGGNMVTAGNPQPAKPEGGPIPAADLVGPPAPPPAQTPAPALPVAGPPAPESP